MPCRSCSPCPSPSHISFWLPLFYPSGRVLAEWEDRTGGLYLSEHVILDEATSYTDPENEAVIQSALGRLVRGKTLLVIAHRLSTIADADQIIVVNQGKIEATGTQAELLASCPLYQTMWEAHISVKDDGEVA